MKNTENFNIKLKEFKSLNAKRNHSKGFMQGLDLKQYDRINSLHGFLVSSNEGMMALTEMGFFS